jgi:O-antigen/teichoic acid export membrane protein
VSVAAPLRQHVGPMIFVTGAKVVGGVSLLALNVWVARHLSPAAYGWFAIASTASLLVDGVIGAAIDAAVIKRTDAAPGATPTAAERAGLILKLGAGAGLCAGAAAAALIAGPTAAGIAVLSMLAGAGLLALRSVFVYLQLRERFARFAVIDLAHTVARWAFVAGGLMTAASSASAVAGIAAAAWAVASIAMLGITQRAASSGDTRVRSDISAVTRAAGIALATTAVGAVVARLDLLLIGAFGTAHDAGIFGAASTIALAPTWLGAYLAPVFSARILPYCRDQRLQPLFRTVQGALIVLAVGGVAFGAVAGPMLIERLLPDSYAAAGDVVPVLLVAGAAGFVTFPLVLHTLLLLSPRTYLAIDLVSLPVLIPLYVVAARESGATGVAWVTAIAALVKGGIAQATAAAVVRREQARCANLQTLSTATS